MERSRTLLIGRQSQAAAGRAPHDVIYPAGAGSSAWLQRLAAAHISVIAKFRNGGRVCASPTSFYTHGVPAFAETPVEGMKQSRHRGEGGARRIRDYLDAKFTNMAFLP